MEENSSNQKVGTTQFMAPEVLMDLPYDGNKADIFSIGVILFVTYSGFQPFATATNDDQLFCSLVYKEFDAFWKTHDEVNPSV